MFGLKIKLSYSLFLILTIVESRRTSHSTQVKSPLQRLKLALFFAISVINPLLSRRSGCTNKCHTQKMMSHKRKKAKTPVSFSHVNSKAVF